MTDLRAAVEKALSAEKRENESYFQFFDRLNHEGRIDVRSLIYILAAILDDMETPKLQAVWDMPPREKKQRKLKNVAG